MPQFRLFLSTSHGETPSSLLLDATDGVAPEQLARIAIAEAFDQPEALVLLDPVRGRFTAGAGFWCRTGHYEIREQAYASEEHR